MWRHLNFHVTIHPHPWYPRESNLSHWTERVMTWIYRSDYLIVFQCFLVRLSKKSNSCVIYFLASSCMYWSRLETSDLNHTDSCRCFSSLRRTQCIMGNTQLLPRWKERQFVLVTVDCICKIAHVYHEYVKGKRKKTYIMQCNDSQQ